MDDLEIINVTDEDELAVDGNNEDEVNILEDVVVDNNVYVSDTVIDDLPDIIEAGQFYIYVPIASVKNKGIAQYNTEHFVVEDGVVYAKLSPKAIADKNGEDITNTYQRKDNMIDQWLSDLTGKYPSAELVKNSLDQTILNKGKGVFVFETEEDFLQWITGLRLSDTTGKLLKNLLIGDDILIIGSKTSYWCKSKSFPLTKDDFEPYNEDFWGNINGDITLQKDLMELFDNIDTRIGYVNTKITTINNKIPTQASSTNKLADKDFVNSSIETATATFRGTFTSINDLLDTVGDKNDYAFYDTVYKNNREFRKYKWDGKTWKYEYTLNNSSFTDAQWKAINSGATAELINQILTNTDSINEILQTLDTVDERLNNTVDKISNEDIGGIKNFTSRPTVNNSEVALLVDIGESLGTTVYENGDPVATFNADTKLDKTSVNSSNSTKPFDKIPFINSAGVMEVGTYVDFHSDNTTGNDYSTRLYSNGENKNAVKLPSGSGTLALTTDNVASATKATQDGNGKVISNTYLSLTGGTLTGSLTLSNGGILKSTADLNLTSENSIIRFGTPSNANAIAVLAGGSYNFFRPSVNNTLDLGNSTTKWKDGYFAGNVDAGSLSVSSTYPQIKGAGTNVCISTNGAWDGTGGEFVFEAGGLRPSGNRSSKQSLSGWQNILFKGDATNTNGAAGHYIVKNTGISRGTAPSANTYHQPLQLQDSAGKIIGAVEVGLMADKKSLVNLIAYKGTSATDNANARIEVGWDKNGSMYTFAPTPAVSSNTTNIATTAWVRSYICPAGTVIAFAGSTTPSGWLLCDGSAVSRTTYAALYSAIGTNYGTGDGSTTFNIPKLNDNRFIEGYTSGGTKKDAGVPNIQGVFAFTVRDGSAKGAFSWGSVETGKIGTGSSYATKQAYFNASTGDTGTTTDIASTYNTTSVYGKSTTVQPKSLTMRYIIKY